MLTAPRRAPRRHANADDRHALPRPPRSAPARRAVPLVLVASPDAAAADAAAERLRGGGAMAYAAHSWQGALRVATAVRPDVVLLDPALPPRLARLLRAHPTSARAAILPLVGPAAPVGLGPAEPTRPSRCAA